MSSFLPSRRPVGRFFAVAAAASLAALPVLSARAQVVGINAAVRNSVQIRGAGAQQVRPAVLRQRISLNDEVRTGSQSQLQVLLLDRSVFTVGSNARLTVDRFVYDPARSVRSVGATVTRGAFRFMSGRSLGLARSNSTIRTPVATIGIRGTIVEGVVGREAIDIAAGESAVGPGVGGDDGRASLIVLRGPGPQTQGNSRPGVIDIRTGNRNMVLDRPSLAIYIPRPGAAPIGPFEISRAGLIRIQQLLSPPLSIAPSMAGVQPGDAGGDGRAELVTQTQGSGQGAVGGSAAGSLPSDRRDGHRRLWHFLSIPAVIAGLIVLLGDGGDAPPTSP